jgi:hypothetical protein
MFMQAGAVLPTIGILLGRQNIGQNESGNILCCTIYDDFLLGSPAAYPNFMVPVHLKRMVTVISKVTESDLFLPLTGPD